MMATMKAVRIHSYGGPEVLRYEDVPRPTARAGEVLIRVHAAGVNPFDWNVRAGYLKDFLPLTLPITLGWSMSGVIEAIGPDVTDLRSGDEIYAQIDLMHGGAYAEYIVVRASDVVSKPQSLDHIHAAAVPHAALAAWQALFDTAGLSAGQIILIHGAAGGVGTFAVQMAKWRGAHVIGTASANNLDFLRQLGVDHAIDYTATRFEDHAHDVDVVLDTIGGDTQQRSWIILKPGGILISLISPLSVEMGATRGVRSKFLAMQPNAAQLAEIGRQIDAGQLRPIVTVVLPLQDARQAQELSESRHTRGKIVLQVVN